MKKTIDYLRDNDLTLLTAHKEGGFVVMPVSIYQEKASQELGKNFVPLAGSKTKIKKEAVVFCEHLNFPHLGNKIGAAKDEGLKIFFSGKTHKEGMPLRAIMPKKGSCQGVMSGELQKHLNHICVDDPS